MYHITEAELAHFLFPYMESMSYFPKREPILPVNTLTLYCALEEDKALRDM
jgi:hypothetical protein